jgi:hypothetical protein
MITPRIRTGVRNLRLSFHSRLDRVLRNVRRRTHL